MKTETLYHLGLNDREIAACRAFMPLAPAFIRHVAADAGKIFPLA